MILIFQNFIENAVVSGLQVDELPEAMIVS